MRRRLIIFLLINLLAIAFLARSVFTLLTLLFEDASEDAIHHSELPTSNSSLLVIRPQLIPKIIHQTYITESIPSEWQPAQRSCIDLHPDYEYKLWTDAGSREFVAAEYPWFLDTFDGYSYPIQRADAIRYFVLAHFGGVYLDLDNGCNRRLDPLLSYPAWVHVTKPTGISNDALGAIPQHPFFLHVIDSLQKYNRHWLLPYITVMYSTGPLFLSVLWKEWMVENARKPTTWAGRVRVLLPEAYSAYPWSFFIRYGGSSWHGRDARFIFWMAAHWMLLTALGFIAAGVVGMCLWRIYRRISSSGAHKRHHGRRERLPMWARWSGEEQSSSLDLRMLNPT